MRTNRITGSTTTPRRRTTALVSLLAAALVAGACGDGGTDASASADSTAPSEAASEAAAPADEDPTPADEDTTPADEGGGETPDQAAVLACLQDAGFDATEDEPMDLPGYVSSVTFIEADPEPGDYSTGSIVWYETADRANEVVTQGAAYHGEDTAVVQAGAAVSTYTGGDNEDRAADVEACL